MISLIQRAVKTICITIYYLLRFKFRKYSTAPEKSISITLPQDDFHRYIYTFVKFFTLEGYSIYLCYSPQSLFNIIKNRYAKELLNEPNVHFTNQKMNNSTVSISIDYFQSHSDNSYHIPMTQHPVMYAENLWNITHAPKSRKKAIFFAGNYDNSLYSRSDITENFGVINRVDLLAIVINHCISVTPSTLNEFNTPPTDFDAMIVDTSIMKIPSNTLRQVIAEYSFFLAAPGVIMPYAHNIIEAMSVGTIPIIQDSYAKLFSPPLTHKQNALIFEDQQTLTTLLTEFKQLDPETIQEMSTAVLNYYTNNLTPSVVVNNIISQNYETIYLNGEHSSLHKRY